MFDTASGEELRVLRGHDGGAVAVAVDAAGRRAVSGTLQGELLVWDLMGTAEPRRLPAHDDSIWGIAVSATGSTAVTSSEDGVARVWDLDAGDIRHQLTVRNVRLRNLALSPDGTEVAIGCGDYAVRRWDLRELVGILTGHWSEALCVAYAPDGSMIAAGAQDGTLMRWARGEEDPLDAVLSRPGTVLAAGFDPSGDRLLLGTADGSLQLWHAGSGELLEVLRGHTGPVTGVEVHRDGRRAVSCSMDGSVRIWDLVDVRELQAFTDNEAPVAAALFDGDDIVVSASVGGAIFARSTATGRSLRHLPTPRTPQMDMVLEYGSGVTMQVSIGGHGFSSLARDPDGRSLLAVARDGTSRLWLRHPETPENPPPVDPDQADPYAAFHELYRSVGWRVVRDGPRAGELHPVLSPSPAAGASWASIRRFTSSPQRRLLRPRRCDRPDQCLAVRLPACSPRGQAARSKRGLPRLSLGCRHAGP